MARQPGTGLGFLVCLRCRADWFDPDPPICRRRDVNGGLAVIGTGDGLKVIADRPRPGYALLESLPSDLSFPSGHSLLAVIVGGVLVYLVELWVKPLLLLRSL